MNATRLLGMLMATALVLSACSGGGGLGVYFDDFTDAKARDPEVLALAAKVHTYADEECSRIFPRQFPAVLRVTLQDGTVYEERVLHNRGGPGNPLSDAELRQKFALNAGQLLPHEQVEQLADAAFGLDRAAGVDELLSLCRPLTPSWSARTIDAGVGSGAEG